MQLTKQPYLMFQSRVKEILDSSKPMTPITPLEECQNGCQSFEVPRPLSALIKEFSVQSNKKKTTFQFVKDQYQQDQQFSNNKQERRAILKEFISQSFVGDESYAGQSSSRQISPRKVLQPIYRLTQKDINLYDKWKIKFQSRNIVIFESVYDNYTNILMAAHQRYYQDFINLSIDIIGEQIKFQRKEFFIKYLHFCSQFFFEIEEYNKSAFFAKQTFIVALYFQYIKYKIQSLLMLSKVSIRLKEYDQSIIYLLNSLEYTWFENDLENESKIYDMLGLCLYYKQMSFKAQFFHNRFVNGVIEPNQSNLKRNTIQTLILYEKNLEDKYGKCSNINFFLLNQLQLPQHYQRRKGRLSFMFGQMNNQEAYESETFDKIYSSIEQYLLNDLSVETIIQTNFQEQVYRNPNHFIYEGNSPPSAFPKHILEIKQRHKSFQEKHNRQIPFFSSNENKLKRRLGEKYSVEKIFEQVRNRVEYNLKISKLDQVYLNHQNYKPETNQIVQKVKQLLEELIK
ncbi:hypothetical protein pb186bvf_007566 [Paramecium bursaria]